MNPTKPRKSSRTQRKACRVACRLWLRVWNLMEIITIKQITILLLSPTQSELKAPGPHPNKDSFCTGPTCHGLGWYSPGGEGGHCPVSKSGPLESNCNFFFKMAHGHYWMEESWYLHPNGKILALLGKATSLFHKYRKQTWKPKGHEPLSLASGRSRWRLWLRSGIYSWLLRSKFESQLCLLGCVGLVSEWKLLKMHWQKRWMRRKRLGRMQSPNGSPKQEQHTKYVNDQLIVAP